jgi:hypothetical protein
MRLTDERYIRLKGKPFAHGDRGVVITLPGAR